MGLNKWFRSKKLWLRGGIAGALVCVLLFLFYLYVYTPILRSRYEDPKMLPSWAQVLPTVTGHFVPLLSGFIVPYGFLCEFTEPTCANWKAGECVNGGAPWTMVDPSSLKNTPGCCLEKTMQPTAACANLSEMIGFFGLAAILVVIYFIIGSAIGWIMQKIKTR